MGQLQVKIPDTGAPVGLYQLVGSTVQRSVLGQKPVDDHIDSGVAKRVFGCVNFSHGEKEHKLPKDQHDQNGEREQPPSHLFETAHSFGHPTVDMIIDRFLSRDAPLNSGTHQLVEAHRSAFVWDLNLYLTHVQALLDMEKQRSTALDQLRMAAGQCEHHWWEGPAEEMNLPQLHQFKAAIIELRTKI
ncbi:hypothetical protein ACSBR1_019513 [Camellia fascicularis]